MPDPSTLALFAAACSALPTGPGCRERSLRANIARKTLPIRSGQGARSASGDQYPPF
jgi:hypothetical protein